MTDIKKELDGLADTIDAHIVNLVAVHKCDQLAGVIASLITIDSVLSGMIHTTAALAFAPEEGRSHEKTMGAIHELCDVCQLGMRSVVRNLVSILDVADPEAVLRDIAQVLRLRHDAQKRIMLAEDEE